MTTYVVLLRGINVGGQKKIKMADLRVWLETAGMQGVRTYIQSGNLVLDSSYSRQEVEQQVHQTLLEHTGWDIPVCARSAEQWQALVDALPYPEAAVETPQFIGVVFFHALPQADPTAGLKADEWLPEQFAHHQEELYLHLPGGFGRTKLTNNFWEKQAGVHATTRNWKTVLTLQSMND